MKFIIFAMIATIALTGCVSSGTKSAPEQRTTASVSPDRGRPFASCLYVGSPGEGQVFIFKTSDDKGYIYSYSGIYDSPTKILGNGPTGLILEFVDESKQTKYLFLMSPASPRSRTREATISTKPYDASTVESRLECKAAY